MAEQQEYVFNEQILIVKRAAGDPSYSLQLMAKLQPYIFAVANFALESNPAILTVYSFYEHA